MTLKHLPEGSRSQRRLSSAWRTRLRSRFGQLAAGLVTLLLGASAQGARPPVVSDGEPVSISARLDSLSEKLRDEAEPTSTGSWGFKRLGQWVNWPNWPNWPNWNNWNNWRNWPNW